MSSDITLLIFNPQTGAMVRSRWLGGNGTRDRVRELCSSPLTSPDGSESWDTTPAVVRKIAEASYHDGATPDEIDQLTQRYPCPPHWWMIDHGF